MKKILLIGVLLLVLCSTAFSAEVTFGVGPRFGGGYHFVDDGIIFGGAAANVGWGFGGSSLGLEVDILYMYGFYYGFDAISIPIFFRGSTGNRFGYFCYGVGMEIDAYLGGGTDILFLLVTGIGFNAGRGTIDLELRFATDFDYYYFNEHIALMLGYTFRF